MKKSLVTLFSFLTILSFVLAGCGPAADEATPTPYPTPVRKTYTVGVGDIVINAELFGQVQPKALSTAFFQMSGHVAEVYVHRARVGTFVADGAMVGNVRIFVKVPQADPAARLLLVQERLDQQ